MSVDLPFSPIFFKKINTYKELMIWESQNKSIWKAEKVLLRWAASKHHGHPGEYVRLGDIRSVYIQALNDLHLITQQEFDLYMSEDEQIINSLANREYAVLSDTFDRVTGERSVRINKDGLIAGQVLLETSLLQNRGIYIFWEMLWWVVLILGGIILLSQSLNASQEILQRFSGVSSQISKSCQSCQISPKPNLRQIKN